MCKVSGGDRGEPNDDDDDDDDDDDECFTQLSPLSTQLLTFPSIVSSPPPPPVPPPPLQPPLQPSGDRCGRRTGARSTARIHRQWGHPMDTKRSERDLGVVGVQSMPTHRFHR